MEACVIYARVSTKEQQQEGYSVPAQLKAIREFCQREGLEPAAEFTEAQSAGRAGRRGFGEMISFLKENPEVRIVVAHKLDRLYRNFSDQVKLEEELGVRARHILGDVPASPQGELLRDVQLSVAKYYLGNLREEVMKGMQEKVEQGGHIAKAPIGYLNDRKSRALVIDPDRAPLVRYAFERYACSKPSARQRRSPRAFSTATWRESYRLRPTGRRRPSSPRSAVLSNGGSAASRIPLPIELPA